MKEFEFGVIGGSGVYEMQGLEVLGERTVETPFGAPSGAVLLASLKGRRVAFLPRHGKGHVHNPTQVNYRANVFALKSLGVKTILSVSAVGSLEERMKPRDFVLPSQLIDQTRSRARTFFDDMAVHVGLAEPFCPRLRATIAAAAKGLKVKVHNGGTLVCIEGPQFSTKAESELYRSWKANIIGMTATPEVRLAREAEICYATIALVTDYDVWKDEHVTVDQVVAVMKTNVENAQQLLTRVIEAAEHDDDCPCRNALANAIMTQPQKVSDDRRRALAPLLGRYLPAGRR